MLSSNFLGFLAMAGFALTTATAAAIQPRAADSKSSNKVCTNTFYSSPQCCIPNENGLDTPDCITRMSHTVPSHLHYPFCSPMSTFSNLLFCVGNSRFFN